LGKGCHTDSSSPSSCGRFFALFWRSLEGTEHCSSPIGSCRLSSSVLLLAVSGCHSRARTLMNQLDTCHTHTMTSSNRATPQTNAARMFFSGHLSGLCSPTCCLVSLNSSQRACFSCGDGYGWSKCLLSQVFRPNICHGCRRLDWADPFFSSFAVSCRYVMASSSKVTAANPHGRL
jgi:hypothetical protein